MKKLFVLVAVAVLLLAASCDSKNTGNGWPELRPSNIQITVPTGMLGNANADWSVAWTSNRGPFTVVWNFGNGANPNTVTNTATTTTNATTVQMLNASVTETASYTVTVTITDSQGRSNSATSTYTVGPIPNQTPTIASAIYTPATKTLVVTVNDADNAQTLDVTVTVPPGLAVDAATKTAAQTGPLTASFVWSATDFFTGGSGTTTITVEDQDGGTATGTADITVAGFTPAADTIYAVPMANATAQATPVRVVIATGVPASPFQFLVGANITMPTWATYVANSFNVGAVGGEREDPDGIWGADGMGVTSFLLGPDSFLNNQEKADIGIAGRHRLELSVTPLDDRKDITGESGALCNIELEFAQAGSCSLGFIQAMPPIDRTYYRQDDGTNHYWGTLMAGADGVLTTGVTGVDNVIVVN